jgi:hypothetical protein
VFEDPPGATGGRLDFKVGPKSRALKSFRLKKDAPVAPTDMALNDAPPWTLTVVAAPDVPASPKVPGAPTTPAAQSAVTPVDATPDAAEQDK